MSPADIRTPEQLRVALQAGEIVRGEAITIAAAILTPENAEAVAEAFAFDATMARMWRDWAQERLRPGFAFGYAWWSRGIRLPESPRLVEALRVWLAKGRT